MRQTRQTAEIAFGPPDSAEYVDLKNYDVNPHRQSFGWTSNNSVPRARIQMETAHGKAQVFCELGQDYGPLCERVRQNGEPGFAWLHNMRAYGRMADPPVRVHAAAEVASVIVPARQTWRDERAAGGNPCLEQTLESFEMCCLVETFPNNHKEFACWRFGAPSRAAA